MTLYTIAVVVCVAYLLITCLVFDEIPKSISETYYLWAERKKGILFTLFMWTCSFCLFLPWLSVSRENTEWLVFLSITGMMFVGTASAFKEVLTRAVHYMSAGIWATSAVAWAIMHGAYIEIATSALLALILYFHVRKSFTFFAELACVIMMMFSIATRLI